MNLKSNERLLKGFTFSFFTSMAIIVSYFPLYFDYKGYSKFQIGMLYSIGPMIGIISNLIWGIVSDRFQTIKKILIVLLIGQLLAALLAFQTDKFALLYIWMAAFFFFQQPMTSLNDSQLMLHASQSGKSYASFRIWGSVGFAAAAGVFGQLLKAAGSGITPLLTFAAIGMTFLLACFLRDARGDQKKMELGGMFQVLGSRKLLWFLFLIMIMSVSHRFNDGFLALYLRQLGAPDTIVGFSWMASALSEIPVFFFLSKYGHRYKELPLLAFAGFAYALRFLLVGFVQEPFWVIFIQLMHSVTFGVFLFTAIRYMAQAVPDDYRASGQAVFAVTWSSLAGLISGTVGGWLFDAWGGSTVYLLAAGLSFLSALGFLGTHLYYKEEVYQTS